MRTVGIKALKNQLSAYVRLAADGETVLVTDRDRVVAELGPPRPGRSETVTDALLVDLLRKGWLMPPRTVGGAPPRRPVARAAELLRELAEDRGDR